MPRPSQFHPYSDRRAFDRLMALIALLAHRPGVGGPDPLDRDLSMGNRSLEQIAEALGDFLGDPSTPPKAATLHKDLAMLRRYGLLQSRPYRWGYYLGSGGLLPHEVSLVLFALTLVGDHWHHRGAADLAQILEKRFRPTAIAPTETPYPTRQLIDRPIIHTDPMEMMAVGENTLNLYHGLPALEAAMAVGQGVILQCCKNPYFPQEVGPMRVFPLQLLYREIAWYLLFEHGEDGHWEIGRVDRFGDGVTPWGEPRGRTLQEKRLREAIQLLARGWGLYLGDRRSQTQERSGRVPLEKVVVRFFAQMIPFILEGRTRHPTQQLHRDPQGQYVDFQVMLPGRSFDEFYRWVCRFGDQAMFLTPPSLVQRHQNSLRQGLENYQKM